MVVVEAVVVVFLEGRDGVGMGIGGFNSIGFFLIRCGNRCLCRGFHFCTSLIG